MHMTTTTFQDINKHNRLDAGFYIALDCVREAYAAMCQRMTSDEALARLARIRTAHKQAVLVLSRHSLPYRNQEKSIQAACKEYPRLSLTLVEDAMSDAIKELKQAIDNDRDYLDLLVSVIEEGDKYV